MGANSEDDVSIPCRRNRKLRRGLLVRALLPSWLALIGTGFLALFWHGTTPGVRAIEQVQWPEDVPISVDPDLPRLLLFVHPRCACTQATLNELAHIEKACHGQVAIQLFFYLPADLADDWKETPIVRQAQAIPGVQIQWDRDGELARRFGATTSGHVLLYSQAGELVFRGGITPSRGHEGANRGGQAVVHYLHGIQPKSEITSVYGCSIFKPGDRE